MDLSFDRIGLVNTDLLPSIGTFRGLRGVFNLSNGGGGRGNGRRGILGIIGGSNRGGNRGNPGNSRDLLLLLLTGFCVKEFLENVVLVCNFRL